MLNFLRSSLSVVNSFVRAFLPKKYCHWLVEIGLLLRVLFEKGMSYVAFFQVILIVG
jgi:hypothetical protein